VLEGDPTVPNLVAVSYYDQKPVHFLSTICQEIKWIRKERSVFNVDTGKVQTMEFLRLAINDDYNHKMGNVDIADQLRNYYRFDHWMRKRKWWWSMFFWGFGVLLVNCYVSYKTLCKSEGVIPMSHYEFRKRIALAWMNPDKYWPNRFSKKAQNSSAGGTNSTNTASSQSTLSRKRGPDSLDSESSSVCNKKKCYGVRVTDRNLDPRTGELRNRLGFGPGQHGPVVPSQKYPACALHNWAYYGNKDGVVRKQILFCDTCKVSLCVPCWKRFHEIQEVADLKASMGASSNLEYDKTKKGIVEL
jgi:hypothetical protein